jgi:hypothetical protein
MRLKGYVGHTELIKKSKKNKSIFSRNSKLSKKSAGGAKFIKIDTLSQKYQKIVKDKCTDLSNLYPAAHFFSYANASERYEQGRNFEYKYVGTMKMLEFDDNFLKLQEDMTPYIILKEQTEIDAKSISDLSIHLQLFIEESGISLTDLKDYRDKSIDEDDKRLVINYQSMKIGFY